MEAGNIIKVILIAAGVIYSSGIQAQNVEYDDLYFNKSDRKKQKELIREAQPIGAEVPATTQEYSSKNINPEYLARYDASEETTFETAEPATEEYTAEDYYVETDERIENNQAEVINAHYSNTINRPDYYRNSYRPWRHGYGYGLSPYYSPPGWNVGLGYNFGSFYGAPFSGYNLSLSWSSGGYYSYYDPWYDPWYDSWYGYSPYYYHRSPWRYGFGSYFGYNYYYPRYNYVTIIEGHDHYTYGRRGSRSSSYVSTRDYDSRSRTNVENRTGSRSTANNSRSRVSTRDYSSSQNEYYSRSIDSRSSVNRSSRDVSRTDRSASSSRIYNATDSRSSTTVERPTRSRSYSYPDRNSSRDYNRSNYYNSRSRSSDNNNNYTPSRSRSSSDSYSRPSRSRSSYSQPSRSRSSSYSSGSRSSSGRSYSTPSRSSGSRSSRGGR